MKKLIALLLTLVCAVSLVGCGGSEESELLATETAVGFLDALAALDVEAMSSYLDDSEAIPETAKNLNVENILANLPEEMVAYEDNFKEMAEAIIAKLSSYSSYEITEVADNGGEYVFTADFVSAELEENFFETALGQENLIEILNALVESGQIDETTTDDEAMNLIFAEIVSIINEMELETSESNKEITVYEKDGKWVVNAEKSNIK